MNSSIRSPQEGRKSPPEINEPTDVNESPNDPHPKPAFLMQRHGRGAYESEPCPIGYEYARKWPEEGDSRPVRWLLPSELLDRMEAERTSSLVSDAPHAGVGQLPDRVTPSVPSPPALMNQVAPLLPELPAKFSGRPSVPIELIAQSQLDQLAHIIKSGDKAKEQRAQEIKNRLKANGTSRHKLYPLCQQKHESVVKACFEPLFQAHPHFGEVIDFYQDCALAQIVAASTSGVMSPGPILLLGTAGLGKTHFSYDLAQVMGLPFTSLAFDSGLTNSVLIGSDKHWSNTHHGALFEHLCLGAVANPIMLLDELDKGIGAKEGHQSALSALHSCLEPISAKSVKDISVEVAFDASHVIWIATANDKHLIPPTILSRFTVFEVLPPVGEAAYWVTWHLCQTVLQTDGQGMEMPSGEIRSAMSVFSPRQQRQSLQQAIQKARAAGRQKLRASDFGGVVQQELQESHPLNQTVRPNGKRKTMQTQWIH